MNTISKIQEHITKQDVYCHNCNCHVEFEFDLNLDGKCILKCPNCEHEHCRIVENGEITEERWASRNSLISNQLRPSNGPVYYASVTNFSTATCYLDDNDSTMSIGHSILTNSSITQVPNYNNYNSAYDSATDCTYLLYDSWRKNT